MDIKEVIQYIAEQDLEINLTFQVSSDSGEDLKEEVRQLRQQIKELQGDESAHLPEPEIEADEREVSEEKAFEEEADSVDEVPPEDDITEKPNLENVEPEPSESSDEEAVFDEKETEEEDAGEESKFDEMFGGGDEEDVPTPSERRTPGDPPEEEPTEEERSEAGADFEELFGEV